MEEAAVNAIKAGINTPDGVFNYIKATLSIIDNSFVTKYAEKITRRGGVVRQPQLK